MSTSGTLSMANGQTDNFNVTAFYDYDGEDWNLGTVGGGFLNSAIDDFSYTGGGTYSLSNIPAEPTTAPGTYYSINGTVTESGVDHTDHSYSGIITGFGGTVSVAGSGSANVTKGSDFAYSGSGSYTSIVDGQLTVSGDITAHSGHTNDNASFTTATGEKHAPLRPHHASLGSDLGIGDNPRAGPQPRFDLLCRSRLGRRLMC